jgi:hypothetical protein
MGMKMSTYQHGFTPGVVGKNVPMVQTNPGLVWWVGNNATLVSGEIAASDANKGTYYAPFATIDKAINMCAANRNDIIYVRPNHSETVDAATDIVPDTAGIQIIGLGNGENRPTITFATSTAANIPISGANTRLSNFILKCNIASQVAMITTTADGVVLDNCDFREGTATGLNFVTVGAADGDSDRLRISNCSFYMPTAGNGDHAIEILKDMTNVVIEDCDIDGDFDEGGILVPAGGDAQVNLQILRCNVKNRLTNIAAISISGTDSSGLIQDCLLRTDTQATALDSGSLAVDNVRWADETDQVSSVPVLAPQDSASNPIGVNDADNSFSSSSVVANLDGSVLERLEALMDPLGGYDPVLGFRVTKTSNLADGSGTDNLFTVTGRCLITHLSGEVTTVIGGAATMKLSDITNSVDLCAATTIDSDAVGTMYALPGLSAQVLNGTGGTPVIGSVPNVTTPSSNAGLIIGDVQAPLTIAHVLDAADTGAVAWVLYYKPLTAASSIVAAA